jgi:hypothetical protein
LHLSLTFINLQKKKCAGISDAQVRKELALEEEARIAGGGVLLHATSASAFVYLALELEDLQ